MKYINKYLPIIGRLFVLSSIERIEIPETDRIAIYIEIINSNTNSINIIDDRCF